MKAITNRQQEVLDFIKSYIERNSYPPTIREISDNFGISVKGAYDHVKAIERKGYISLNTHRSRTIEVLNNGGPQEEPVVSVPLLGNVAAGKPLFAEENYDGSVPVPQQLIGTGTHFALHVRGDSMNGAGIMDGDVAIFRQQPSAENGDIVVATVDDAVTLKRFYRETNRVKLKAENPNYPPIYTQDVRVLGKLAHIIRSYA
ncbi:MAG: transcriptional repressor LexA [Spirochaetes bacterium]|jgi:repressor LexA|nr:transcriptional repressor LexA [Spirochaetota bacterium]